jgi:hypothetical protein
MKWTFTSPFFDGNCEGCGRRPVPMIHRCSQGCLSSGGYSNMVRLAAEPVPAFLTDAQATRAIGWAIAAERNRCKRIVLTSGLTLEEIAARIESEGETTGERPQY